MACGKWMPPYRRDRAASRAASWKEPKVRAAYPRAACEWSVKRNAPSRSVSTAAAAGEATECPEVCSGNCGVLM